VLPRSTADTIGLWRESWTDPHVAAREAHGFLRAQLAVAAS
jgi:D-psicose/D-tagatose/L-ribulose 3-epimerase